MWQILFFALPPQIKPPQINGSNIKHYTNNKAPNNKAHKIKYYDRPINRKPPKKYKTY